MKRSYYSTWYRLDGNDRYLIWYRLEKVAYDGDGVVVNAEGDIPTFASLNDLHAYATLYEIPLEDEEPLLLDLDVIQRWLDLNGKPARKRIRRNSIDCKEFLDTWNLFADVRFSFDPPESKRLTRHQKLPYDKLFCGCNLPAMTPPGKWYIPIWSNAEVKVLRDLLGRGMKAFRERVILWQPQSLS